MAKKPKSTSPDEIRWRKLFALLPGYSPTATAAPGDWFDPSAADRATSFFPDCLRFIEGVRAGQPFELEPWQQAIIGCLFGWKRADGLRRYREAFVYVPRKNGKTPTCAGLVNYVLFCDREPGAQIYSAAAEREQAALVFRHAAGMIERQPALASRAKIYRTFKSIEYQAENSVYKALSADAATKHGFNSHLVIVDELHAHRDAELVDVLQTSTASRSQPLIIHITTADWLRESVCNSKYEYACKVRDRAFDDSSFLPAIWEATPDQDWTSPKTWAACNPNLGVSVSADYLARECRRAQESPAYENVFKRLHLNIRTENNTLWLPVDVWLACGGAIDVPSLAGRDCYAGLDLAANRDFNALTLWFPPAAEGETAIAIWRFWVPEDNAHQRERRDRIPYSKWAKEGWLTMTAGNSTDYAAIRRDLTDLASHYVIRGMAVDRLFQGNQLMGELADDGFDVIPFGQGYLSMTSPVKELERLLLAGGLRHGDNPVAKWMFSNLAVEMDAAGNVKFSKRRSSEKIDGMISLVMALGIAQGHKSSRSVYEDRGMMVL